MWSWAVTSSRDLGRLGGGFVSQCGLLVVLGCSYYFSTHGCSLLFSGCAGALEEVAAAAASFCRALMSKKFAIVMLWSECGVSVESLINSQLPL